MKHGVSTEDVHCPQECQPITSHIAEPATEAHTANVQYLFLLEGNAFTLRLDDPTFIILAAILGFLDLCILQFTTDKSGSCFARTQHVLPPSDAVNIEYMP